MRKKLLSVLLSLVLVLFLAPTVANAASDEATTSANALHELGLFNGTGTDNNGNPIFDLDRTPTRNEAITMLVRLLGKENEARAQEWSIPFIDVATWARPYVGYAYNNGLTTGTSSTTYGGNESVTPSQYLTFVLRALGYKDNDDFQWNKAWLLSDKIGLTNGQYNENTTNFTRGDVAIISCNALYCKLKDKGTTLIEDLTARGVVKEQHTHDWDERLVEEVGHYESSGTHKVFVTQCNCGFIVTSDDPDASFKWDYHNSSLGDNCRKNYIQWYEDCPNDPTWVVDTPAHYETYCTICGAIK